MSFFDFRKGSAAPSQDLAAAPPTACPTCGSSSITTTAKNPDANTYWRCKGCGDIWNQGRRQRTRAGADRWR
jgi:hypothetical protein